jgi:hypothetical protein
MEWYGLNWSVSGYGAVEGSCEHGNEPSGSINCWEVLECCTIGGFSGRAQLHGVTLHGAGCWHHPSPTQLSTAELTRHFRHLECRGPVEAAGIGESVTHAPLGGSTGSRHSRSYCGVSAWRVVDFSGCCTLIITPDSFQGVAAIIEAPERIPIFLE